MKTKLNLKAGSKGTKKLCEKYGQRLVCVRYRYDPVKKKRYKTVELIEEETEWTPPKKDRKIESRKIVGIRVGFEETALQNKLRKAGAKWDPRQKLWFARHDVAVHIGLEDRIIAGDSNDNERG